MSTATNASLLTAAQAREVISLLKQTEPTPETETLITRLQIDHRPYEDVAPPVLGTLPDGTAIVLDHSPETGEPWSITSYPSGILFDIGIDDKDNRVLIGDEFSIEYVTIERMRLLRDVLNTCLEPMIAAYEQYTQANPPGRTESPELTEIKAWVDERFEKHAA